MIDPSIQAKFDYAIATGAVSSPVWLQWVESGSKLFFIIGGAVLLLIRIAIAVRQYRNSKRGE